MGGKYLTEENLHSQIMNIRTTSAGIGAAIETSLDYLGDRESQLSLAYRLGHRDARHAAAELSVLTAKESETAGTDDVPCFSSSCPLFDINFTDNCAGERHGYPAICHCENYNNSAPLIQQYVHRIRAESAQEARGDERKSNIKSPCQWCLNSSYETPGNNIMKSPCFECVGTDNWTFFKFSGRDGHAIAGKEEVKP